MVKKKKCVDFIPSEQYAVKYRFKGEDGFWSTTSVLISWPRECKNAHAAVEKHVEKMLEGMGLKPYEYEIVNVTYC